MKYLDSTGVAYLWHKIKALMNTKAPTSHAAAGTIHGIGTAEKYGHVKLSDSTASTSAASAGIAASPKAVKAAYDLASTANTAAAAALPKTGGTMTGSAKFTTDTDFLVADTVRYRFHLNTGSVSNPNAFVLQIYNPNNWVIDPITVKTDGSIVLNGNTTFNSNVILADGTNVGAELYNIATVANAAMPKAGGQFTRAVQAVDAKAFHCLRNISVQNAVFENQATGHILMVRK